MNIVIFIKNNCKATKGNQIKHKFVTNLYNLFVKDLWELVI